MPLPRSFRPAVARFSRTRFFRRFGPRIMPPLERAVSRVTHSATPLSGLLVPSLVLHSVGSRSGRERQTPLMYCPGPDGTMFITGSNFASDRHPAWTGNLLARPNAWVEVGRRRVPVTASLVGPEEREAVWTRLEENWPGYRGYERASGRELRIFRLVPRSSSVPASTGAASA